MKQSKVLEAARSSNKQILNGLEIFDWEWKNTKWKGGFCKRKCVIRLFGMAEFITVKIEVISYRIHNLKNKQATRSRIGNPLTSVILSMIFVLNIFNRIIQFHVNFYILLDQYPPRIRNKFQLQLEITVSYHINIFNVIIAD